MQHQTPNPPSWPSEPRHPGSIRSRPRTEYGDARPLEPARRTERPGEESAIRAETERLQEILNRAPAAIAVMEGPEHLVVVANPCFRRLVGERPMLDRTAREALPELAAQGVLDLLDRVWETAQPFVRREMTLRLDRDGDGALEEGAFDFFVEPLTHSDGAVFGVMCHATEVTEQVRAREELAAARAAAERANRSKTDFLAAMSHDLRTPLTAIGGYASLVAEGVYGPVTPGQQEAMSRIARANAHLLTLINDVLRHAQIESGGLSLRMEALPLDDLLPGLGALIEPQVAAKGLTYDCDDIPPDARVRADRARVTQILINLLSNALKFTDAGSVRLTCELTHSEVLIRVQDTGRGIPEGMLTRIFDPFVQVDTDGSGYGGVGLGLSTSLHLARAMGGEITVESELGRGTVFTLALPRA